MLHDAGYGFAGAEYGVHYERLLGEEQEKGSALMETVPDISEFDFLIIKNDYHNLKVYPEAEFSNQEVSATIC